MTNLDKANAICRDYDTRKYRQKDLAEKYGMSEYRIRKVTKAMGYEHGKRVTQDNRNVNQMVSPIQGGDVLNFLSTYDDSLFL